MLDEELLRDALRGAGLPDGSVRYADELESTNATAVELAGEGAPEWTLVAAGRQTSGRGRLGRRWETPRSGGLLFSFVLRPAMPPERVPLLTLLAGRSMAAACGHVGIATAVRCKWPNDLLVGDAKVGGILAEARVTGHAFDHVVVGVGLNLGGAPAVEGAAALPPGDAAALLRSFLTEFGAEYREGPVPRRVLDLYRPVCATLGRRVRATTTGGDTVEGIAVDLDANGGLLIEAEGRRASVAFGEVEHLR